MAKRAKRKNGAENGSGEDGHGVSAFRGNGYDPDIVQSFIGRIENLNGDLAKEKSESMLRCKDIHADVREVYTEAKNAGINKKALKEKVKERALVAKLEAIREDLEGDDQDAFDQIEHALGDLGRAAADRYRASKGGEEAHA